MTSLATSVPQEAFLERPAAPGGFAAEFERLAGRSCTQAERELVARLSDGCSVWAEGFLPEALAHLALSLTAAEGLSALVVGPSLDLLEHRQMRLGTRGPCSLLRARANRLQREPSATQAVTLWATPDRLDIAHLARAFGSDGPDVIILEEAQGLTPSSYSFRPSMRGLKEILARFPKARFVAGASARGAELRPRLANALGLKAFSSKKSPGLAVVVEQSWRSADGPILRVERDPEVALSAVVGPLPRPALVLCSTPAEADEVYAELESAQVPVHRVHSGLPAAERARELVQFSLPGRRAVMVAVSSFGPSSGLLGDDARGVPEGFGHGYARQDLRSIVHLCAPCSLDQYVREISMLSSARHLRSPIETTSQLENGSELDNGSGLENRGLLEKHGLLENDCALENCSEEEQDEQASSLSQVPASGRSDVPRSFALMLFDPEHLADNLTLLERKRPTGALLQSVAQVLLGSAPGALVPRTRIEQETSTSAHRVASVLAFLADLKAVEVTTSDVRVLLGAADFKKTVLELEESFDKLVAGDVPRLQEVENYAVAPGCRVRALCALLGQSRDDDCGACDRCVPLAAGVPAGDVCSQDDAPRDSSAHRQAPNTAESTSRVGKVTPLRGRRAPKTDPVKVSVAVADAHNVDAHNVDAHSADARDAVAHSADAVPAHAAKTTDSPRRGRRAPARKTREKTSPAEELVAGEFLEDAGSL